MIDININKVDIIIIIIVYSNAQERKKLKDCIKISIANYEVW